MTLIRFASTEEDIVGLWIMNAVVIFIVRKGHYVHFLEKVLAVPQRAAVIGDTAVGTLVLRLRVHTCSFSPW